MYAVPDRVCIVGAGPAGLSVARALKRLRIPYDQYERHTDVGGIWDLENPGTPMYESAHFISSRKVSGFFDHPMPASFPDYPGHRQILAYTREFADAHGLREQIRFGTAVTDCEHEDDRWAVALSDGSRHSYRALVCATGTTWTPRMPTVPGQFAGEVRHSVTYRDPMEFRGRRVLVVGLGNSGADIVCDAALVASASFLSVRRGYHVIPKHIFGIPADEFSESGPSLPLRVERPIFTALLRVLQGDLTRLGLPKPDHKLFESHPLLNSQLLHHLQHGDVTVKADVAAFDGDRVRFTDDTTEQVDLVLFATGYDWAIPYVPTDYFRWRDGRPELYLTAFSREHHNLIGLSFLEVNSSAYTLFDQVSNLVAQYLLDQVHDPDGSAAFERMIATEHPDLSGGIHFIDSARHRSYVDGRTFRTELDRVADHVGWQRLQPGMFSEIRQNRSVEG
ncbi:MAG: NAD(P)/FAD-dependent oxidoreductase [Nocardioides sp.]